MRIEAMVAQQQDVAPIDGRSAAAIAGQLALDIARIVATECQEQLLAYLARQLAERLSCDAVFIMGYTDVHVIEAADALAADKHTGRTHELAILAQSSSADPALTARLKRYVRRVARRARADDEYCEHRLHLQGYRQALPRDVTLWTLPLVSARGVLGMLAIARIDRPFAADLPDLLAELHHPLVLALGAHYALESQIRLQRRQEHLEAVFNNSSDGILTVDDAYRVVELNRAVTDLTGWDTKEALGHTCMEVIQCCDERGQPLCHTPRCPLHQVFTRRQPLPYCEVAFTPRTGKLKEVAASFALVNSDEGPKGVIIARDITPLNTANRMRSNFISMVSHELRTPLNSINGFLEIVMEGHVGQLTERQYEFLSYARSSAHQLMSLVEDVLFISKADTGQFDLRRTAVELPELADQLLRNLEPLAQSAEVTLKRCVPEPFPKLDADAVRLQQVLTNLLNNAIKFTPPQGEVTLEASYDAQWALVRVIDTGCGVPYEDQPHIFERFYQSDNASLVKHGGYGLGLAIAKLIVEQHGGRLWLESEPEHGATFSFTLPLWRGDTANDHNDC